jgi:hypothetical protein
LPYDSKSLALTHCYLLITVIPRACMYEVSNGLLKGDPGPGSWMVLVAQRMPVTLPGRAYAQLAGVGQVAA